jgi:beta-1,4-mannosyl-glycoprotein beta-1,4-N-acetylglucosaminyltransferase
MIYDCFTFFNELELLEIRLHELAEVVDKFVLVEATRTFQKKPKPLYFEENKQRFALFLDKIIHIKVDKYPTFFSQLKPVKTWHYENSQREWILKALVNCKPDDQIIISDIDEIPKAEKVKEFSQKAGIKVFEQRYLCYFLNYLCIYYHINPPNPKMVVYAQSNQNGIGYWRGTVMLSYQDLTKKIKTIKEARVQRSTETPDTLVVKEGGWHFSFLGGLEKIIEKLQAYSHTEFNNDYFRNKERIRRLIEKGEDIYENGNRYQAVAIDETFPAYLSKNQAQFSHLIYKVGSD